MSPTPSTRQQAAGMGGARTLRSLGELGWIAEAKRLCQSGIGDDAAILRAGKKDLLLTTDMLLEDRHFRLKEADAYGIGWKAMAVNLSDIAAMAGKPTAAVISLGVPGKTSVRFLKEVYRGLLSAARRFGVRVVGGDTNAAAKWALAVTLLGEAEKGKAVRRSGAKPGDWVFVTGMLGGSYASGKHLRFTPRVREARWLAKNFKLHAMMDLSDGLASDIRRLASESGVGAVLNEAAIPVSPRSRSTRQALSEGEDFELLFALSAAQASRLAQKKPPRGFPGFTHIGWIVKGPRVEWLRVGGRLEKLSLRGFEHFR